MNNPKKMDMQMMLGTLMSFINLIPFMTLFDKWALYVELPLFEKCFIKNVSLLVAHKVKNRFCYAGQNRVESKKL